MAQPKLSALAVRLGGRGQFDDGLVALARDTEFDGPAAILTPWSNGLTEGQITKLKLIKRQMFRRGKINLLHARVIAYA